MALISKDYIKNKTKAESTSALSALARLDEVVRLLCVKVGVMQVNVCVCVIDTQIKLI